MGEAPAVQAWGPELGSQHHTKAKHGATHQQSQLRVERSIRPRGLPDQLV